MPERDSGKTAIGLPPSVEGRAGGVSLARARPDHAESGVAALSSGRGFGIFTAMESGRSQSRKRESPIRDGVLRNPGQGVDEEWSRLIDDKAVSYVLVAAVFLVLAGIEWWRFFRPSEPRPVAASVVALCVTACCAWRLRSLMPALRRLKQAREGERHVGQHLEREARPLGYDVFHDVLGNGFNVDHVLVGPGGVYAVETKTIGKRRGDAKVTYDGATVKVDGLTPDRDPVKQAAACAAFIRDVIRESTGKTVPVRPVVVFAKWFVEKMPRGAEVWVLNEMALVGFLKHEDKRLPPEDVALVSYHLRRHIIAAYRQRKEA